MRRRRSPEEEAREAQQSAVIRRLPTLITCTQACRWILLFRYSHLTTIDVLSLPVEHQPTWLLGSQ